MTSNLTKEQISEYFKELNKKSQASLRRNRTKDHYRRMQALSVVARKKNKLSTGK